MDRFRMHECHLEAEHSAPRRRVDQLGALRGQPRERAGDIVDLVGDVVHSRAALREEPADRGVGAERREKLDAAVAETHRRRLDALLLDALPVLQPAPEEALVRRHGDVEVLDGDADVMNSACFHPGDATAAYEMLAAVRRLAAVALAGLALAGCGSSSSNGEAGKPAAQVVADARAAAAGAKLVHVVGAGTDNGSPLKLDIWLARGRGKGHLEESGTSFDLVRIGKTVYIKGSDAFLRRFAGSAGVTLFHGRWLKGATSDAQLRSLVPLTDIEQFFEGVLGQHGKIVNKGETTRNGARVVEIRDATEGGSLYVAAEGAPYPLALHGGGNQGDISFSAWNGTSTIAAPKDSLDLNSLSGK